MKLIVAVLRKEDEADTIAEMNKKGLFVTELATTGGFLKEKSTTFCPGGNYSAPIDTQTGGCTVFVLNMEQLEKF